uniref:Uncharacterized protein n=1 Tax=Mus spicilegus TaxID=10103 RepID=A0A8C6MW56_MUSSI
MFSMESSAPEILSSISSILLLMLTSMVPDFFPRVSTSSVASLWVFFIVSTSLFRSSMVLFISITCLDVFSCFSLRASTCLVVFSCFSLRTCNSLAVFSCISLSELLKSFLMFYTIIMRYAFKSRSSFSGVLGCSGLGKVGVLGSDDGERSWFLLVRFLRLPFAIW